MCVFVCPEEGGRRAFFLLLRLCGLMQMRALLSGMPQEPRLAQRAVDVWKGEREVSEGGMRCVCLLVCVYIQVRAWSVTV